MLKEQGKEEVNAFDRAWSSAVKNARDGAHVSPELKPLLLDVYLKVLTAPVDFLEVKRSLEQLLTFLMGPGRTNVNCWVTDLFFG